MYTLILCSKLADLPFLRIITEVIAINVLASSERKNFANN